LRSSSWSSCYRFIATTNTAPASAPKVVPPTQFAAVRDFACDVGLARRIKFAGRNPITSQLITIGRLYPYRETLGADILEVNINDTAIETLYRLAELAYTFLSRLRMLVKGALGLCC
jgi:hypothetical protein